MKCPACGLVYVFHHENIMTCPQGHTWDALMPVPLTSEVVREARAAALRDAADYLDAREGRTAVVSSKWLRNRAKDEELL